MTEKIRLQKFIGNSGYCSRRKAEELILENKVKVNNETATLGTKIDPKKDKVYINGKKIELNEKTVYIMLNKPPGFISSCSHKGKKTVIDLVDVKERVYPVGRLDMNSRGLILLINDGELHNRLSHPSFDHEKEYLVKTNIPLTNKEIKLLSEGVVIDGRKTRKAFIKRKKNDYLSITLKEGRNRQIRKMVETLNKKVVDLFRIRMSEILLGSLPEGKWRYLSKNEINNLKK
ncbi:MAG: pseudouridine synthase [Desulforegulaceae bacterium]|nr:pseudouridine synthase [Desulforegulaceae bacterium]